MLTVAQCAQEMFEEQRFAFGYYLKPEAAPEERVYQELPSTAPQLTPLLSTYLDAYNTRFNTNLELGRLTDAPKCMLATVVSQQQSLSVWSMQIAKFIRYKPQTLYLQAITHGQWLSLHTEDGDGASEWRTALADLHHSSIACTHCNTPCLFAGCMHCITLWLFAGCLSQPALFAVLFDDAVEHISSIARVLSQPGGSLMLVGVGGSGKQTMTRFAAFIAGVRCFQIQPTRG